MFHQFLFGVEVLVAALTGTSVAHAGVRYEHERFNADARSTLPAAQFSNRDGEIGRISCPECAIP